jgi:hypothetical protein
VQSGAVTRKDAFAAAGSPLNYIQIPAYDDNGTTHAAVTWYQDPQTKLWYKGQPPISSAALNADGTVKIGADGKLAVSWMPFASAAGVATPYAGTNARAMQKLYDEGLVGTDPRFNQPTGMRDFAGNYTTDPAQSVQTATPYFDPHDESNRKNANDAYFRDDRFAQKADIEAAKKAFAARQSSRFGGTLDAPSFEDQVASLAKNFGISGMGARGAMQGISEGIPAPTPAVLAQRQSALAKLQAVPKVGLAGSNDFAVPRMPSTTSSGPALANLPTSQATKLDISKVTATPTPVKRRTTTSTSTSTPTLDLPNLGTTGTIRLTEGRYAGKVVPL